MYNLKINVRLVWRWKLATDVLVTRRLWEAQVDQSDFQPRDKAHARCALKLRRAKVEDTDAVPRSKVADRAPVSASGYRYNLERFCYLKHPRSIECYEDLWRWKQDRKAGCYNIWQNWLATKTACSISRTVKNCLALVATTFFACKPRGYFARDFDLTVSTTNFTAGIMELPADNLWKERNFSVRRRGRIQRLLWCR